MFNRIIVLFSFDFGITSKELSYPQREVYSVVSIVGGSRMIVLKWAERSCFLSALVQVVQVTFLEHAPLKSSDLSKNRGVNPN